MNTNTKKAYVWQLKHTVTGKVHTKVFNSRREAREMTESTRFKNYRPIKLVTGLTPKATKKVTKAKAILPHVENIVEPYISYEDDLAAFLQSFFEPFKTRKTIGTPVHKSAKLGIKN